MLIGVVCFSGVVDQVVSVNMFVLGVDIDVIVYGMYWNNFFCFMIFWIQYYFGLDGLGWFVNGDGLVIDIYLIVGYLCVVKQVFYQFVVFGIYQFE